MPSGWSTVTFNRSGLPPASSVGGEPRGLLLRLAHQNIRLVRNRGRQFGCQRCSLLSRGRNEILKVIWGIRIARRDFRRGECSIHLHRYRLPPLCLVDVAAVQPVVAALAGRDTGRCDFSASIALQASPSVTRGAWA